MGLTLLILLFTQGPVLVEQVHLALGAQPLAQAMLLRDGIGDLPLGPGTPAIWALARASSTSTTPQSVQQQPDLRGQQLTVEQWLQEAASRLAPVKSKGRRLLGIMLGSQGSYAAAEAVLGEVSATEAPPLAGEKAGDDLLAGLALANVIDAQGRRAEAQTIWRAGDADQAISFQLHREGAELASQGEREQAEAMLLLATEVDPNFPDPYHTLGGFYWGQDQDKAEAMYRKAVDIGGLDPFFEWLALGKLALLDGLPGDAVVYLERAVELRPDHPGANEFLGIALRGAGRIDQAISILEQAAQLSPDASWPLIQLGQSYLELGNYQQAVDALVKALERRADQEIAYTLLAQAYLGAGLLEQAAASWQQAVALRPGDVGYRLNLGLALEEAGQIDQAIAAFQAVLELNPDNVDAQLALQLLGVAPETEP